ncbi:MAG: UbiA family prenyltransferase [Bacilli bacterium]
MKTYLELFRVKHYIKNLLIFTTIIFGADLFTNDFYKILIGFISFSLMSSVIYIINDIIDYDLDKKTPVKKNKPISSGKISKDKALKISILTFFLSLILNYFTCSLFSYLYLLAYFLLNLFYSFYGKNIPYLDLLLIITFYIIRIDYGAMILNVTVSLILNLTVIFGSLYLILTKRRVEIENKKCRKILKKYDKKRLRIFSIISLILMLICYVIWCLMQHIKYIMFTPILVLLIFIRYDKEAKKSLDGNLVDVLLNDKILTLICILYGIIIISLLELYL